MATYMCRFRVTRGVAEWMRKSTAIVLLLGAAQGAFGEEKPYSAVVSPNNSFDMWLLKGDQPSLRMNLGGWGPNWGWVAPPMSHELAKGETLEISSPFTINEKAGEVIRIACAARKAGDQSVSLRYTLSADRDVPLTKLIASFHAASEPPHGSLGLTVDGKEQRVALPNGADMQFKGVSQVAFDLGESGKLTLKLDPPLRVQLNGNEVRVELASELLHRGESVVTLTMEAPGNMGFAASTAEMARFVHRVADEKWFPLTPKGGPGRTVIGMDNWLDVPAGKHGGVRMVDDHFQFTDGTPVKFWGTNLCYAQCAPERPDGERTAMRLARFGVNGVRLHKFTGAGWEGIGDPNDVTKFDAKGLSNFDYFTSRLAAHGVYYGFSHTFAMKVRPGNRDRIAGYDEIVKNLGGSAYSLINFADDLQDLMIEQVVHLLKHRNPQTGKTYAEDPALSYIELQNEDDIFWYNTAAAFQGAPTYAAKLTARFSEWLKQKYGSQEKLKEAWGDSLKEGETLERGTIVVQPNPWNMSVDNLGRIGTGERRRMLDNARFFHEVQNAFYSRFTKAIRETGYAGPICGSPWQAPEGVPHYYNLWSDYLAGYIDRHNYFGEKVSDTMLGRPGSGYLSSGLQQVVDRPFGLSEWITSYPALYSADGPVMMAAYGMGLQGWDSSYEFTSAPIASSFADSTGSPPFGIWNVDSPTQIGQFPALARMVMRGDVKPGEVISVRKVSMEDLDRGTFSFSDKIVQQGDEKTFGGSVPPEALAAGRCVVQFTEKSEPSSFPDMGKYTHGKVITSSTGQLAWDASGQGFFTINTAGTKAVVGFAEGKTQTLGNVAITSQVPYASVIVTAMEKNATLDTAKAALIMAVARNCNTGFTYSGLDGSILTNGTAPVLLEPVKATFKFTGRAVATVHVLDQDGRGAGKDIAVQGGAFSIDTGKSRTIYYQIVFQ